jgi:tetratricopeptide (TPR) repeat protein
MKRGVIFLLLISLQGAAQNTQTYISKGNEYYLQLNFDLAEGQYRQALNLSPRNVEAKYNLANTLCSKKNTGRQLSTIRRLLREQIKTCRRQRITMQGVSYTKQKDLPNSIESYKAALRLSPADKEARENLQKALSELKKQQEDQNKKNGGGGGGMSQKEAEDKLKQLQQKEKDLQQRLQSAGKGKGSGGSKDW